MMVPPMRYVRILANAAIGGALLAYYLLSLFLLLNPSLVAAGWTAGRLELTVLVFYAVGATGIFCGLIVVRQLVAGRDLSPGWISQGLLVWMVAASASVAAAAMWMNLDGFGPALGPSVRSGLSTAATWLALSAAVLLFVALYGSSFKRRRGSISLALFALGVAASVAMPLAAGRFTAAAATRIRLSPRLPLTVQLSSSRVAMLLVDGGSLDFIAPVVAEGRLPNFGRLLDGGAVMHLATLRPTHPLPVWTAVATGKLPYKNGIRSAATYSVRGSVERFQLLPDFCFAHGLVHFGLLTEHPYTSSSLRAQTLWSIAGSAGLTVGIVGWPLTHPAPRVRGFAVSDHFHQRADPAARPDRSAVFPPEDFDTSLVTPYPVDRIATALRALEAPLADAGEGSPVSRPLVVDLEYETVARFLQQRHSAQLTALRFQALDASGHLFLRYASPQLFGDVLVSEDERQRYGRLLEQAYAHVDAAIGREMAALGPDDLLLVVSAFGMEPLSLGKRLLERALGNPDLSGSHEGAPDGFLLAYGASVEPARLRRGSVLDVTPTVLYFLGLPVARDMDGYARADIFTREFAAERPITFIPSYDARLAPGAVGTVAPNPLAP
jgi:hypothetical protein